MESLDDMNFFTTVTKNNMKGTVFNVCINIFIC